MIDHSSGQKTFTIPSDTPGAEKGPRKIVGNNLVLITVGEAQNRVVRGYNLPTETIAKAAKLIEQGGSAADAALPPLKTADRTGAKKVAIAASAAHGRCGPMVPARHRPVCGGRSRCRCRPTKRSGCS